MNRILYHKSHQANYEKYITAYPKLFYDVDLSDLSNNKNKNNNKIKKDSILNNRYILRQKLSENLWLSFDLKYGTHVAIEIKKIEDDEKFSESKDKKEINFLKKLSKFNFDPEWIESLKIYYKNNENIINKLSIEENTNVIQLLNYFIIPNINEDEKYLYKVYEILGQSLQNFLDEYKNKNNKNKGISLPYIKIIAKQILIGLDYIHRYGHIIKSNLNMDNIMLCLTKDELKIIQEIGKINMKQDNNNNDSDKKNNINLKNKKNIIYNKQKIIKRKEKGDGLNLSPFNNNVNIDINSDKNKNKKKEENKINNNDINIDELYKALNEKYDKNNTEFNINSINDDIIKRPKISSIPKININKNNINSKYDFNINKYKNDIQSYINEKNKIKKNIDYRKYMYLKKQLLSLSKKSKDIISIYKKLNKEITLNGPLLDSDIKIKLSGFDNFIKLNHEFNNNDKINFYLIQKQKYLPPEIILDINYYNESIDIWALACILFELATGEPLFEVKADDNFNIRENYVIKLIEIIGKIPKSFLRKIKNKNILQNIVNLKNINYTSIKNILINKYNFETGEAQNFQDFLLPMLNYFPDKRPSAKDMLNHPWLNEEQNTNNNVNINIDKKGENYFYSSENSSNSEEYNADSEDNDNYKEEIYKDNDSDEDSGDENPDKIHIHNYNNSFAEYGQFIDLTNLDKANPQFDEIISPDDLNQ